MNLSLTDSTRRRVARITSIALAGLLLAIVVTISLRAVSADTFGEFGITSQSRMGKLISKIAPQAFASKSTEATQGEAALKLLKDRGQYDSLRQAMETARYRANAEPQRAGQFAALNPAQEFHSRFTQQGLEVRRRSDEATPKLAMTLRGIGYGERQLPVSPGTVSAQDQRVEIQRTVGEQSAIRIQAGPQSAIVEWYINRPSGLEQGFTIAEAPGEKRDGERLRLTLELSGEWLAKLATDGQAVEFSEASGGGEVRYDHLVVRDAQGKTLPARMSLAQRELRLEVEDAGAVWPVTIDPTLAQQAYLKASNTGSNDQFGYSVAISGDTIVVGALDEDSSATGVGGNQTDNSAPASGAVYVFVRSGATWTQQAYLKASNTGGGDWFGSSVAVSGDTVVVGAFREGSNATGVNGNQLDNSLSNAGAAYVFTRSGVTWTQQAYLKASNTGNIDQFGTSVAISGDTVVVGADFESSSATGVGGNQSDDSASRAGAAYVFVRSGVTWTQQAYLKASNTGANDNFGTSVAISSNTIVVGAYGEDSGATGIGGNQADNSALGSGAAYVFVRSGVTWTQQAYLKASNTDANDDFGYSAAVSGDTVVVGAFSEASSATGVGGNQNDDSASGSGAAYVFVRSGVTWTQQAYLKASNTGADDRFGFSVAISGDMVVVGADLEDSNATGVDGNQSNNSASGSGAAYVFMRSGATWTQQSYLKASNTGASDVFGRSVSVSGDTVVVSAVGEASNATGVNGNGSNNSASSSGAAYVFIPNTLPTITAGATANRQQGTAGSTATIATVTDAETAAGSIVVTATTLPTGITVTGISNSNGTVTATVTAGCTAALGNNTVVLTATDGSNTTATANFIVNVTANTAPTLTYSNASVTVGNALTVSPATGPSDNVSVSSIVVQSVSPSTSPGTITVNNSTGVVTVPNNVPAGTYTVTIRATDDCGATTDALFTLTVNAPAPTLGNYSATTMALSAQATVTPSAAPTNTTGIAVKASSGFNGTFYANPATGVVKIVNANPAGTHTVTVTAFSAGGSTTRTFTLTVQSGTACTTQTYFSNAPNLSVGSPVAVKIGDFNNDGKQDLAIANQNSATVSIRLGDGAGNFTGTTTVSTNSSPSDLVVGDFNGDGNQDLAIACGANGVSVRLGDGAGNFSGTTNFTIVTDGIAVGDFNNDGKLDLMYTNSGGGQSSVSLRLGDGVDGFGSAIVISVGSSPNAIAVGDINNDGKLDFVTSNYGPDNVSVRLGDGAGNFSNAADVAGGLNTVGPALADFNKDGKLDLAFSVIGSSAVFVRLGDGLGGFSGATSLASGFPRSIVVGDFNNDGNPDLSVSSTGIDYWLGDGAGGFGSKNNVLPTGIAGDMLAVGDFNQDGRQDFVTGIFNPAGAFVRLGGCNVAPTITAGGPLSRQAGSAGSSSTIATVNDTETAAGSLTVTATTVPTGITVTGITNSSGTITATVTAACNATVGNNTVTLRVTDGGGATATANLTVNVTPNTEPTLTYNNASVIAGNVLTVNPATGPTDNVSVSSIVVQSVSPSTAPGTITVNNSTGVVTVPNNVPAGTYTVTIRATDNCGATRDASFTLTVNCITSLTVNDLGDGADATPGNGVCETGTSNGICTLRAAIQEANALTGCSPFTINFSVTGTITLASALPNIIHPNLTISGPGADQLTISGNNAVRVFTINPGNLNITLSGLTVANGNFANAGSGLSNQSTGTTTITNCAFANNAATSGAFGGGIYHFNAGTLNVTGSTFNGNSASAGGAIYNNAAGTVNLTNCTFSGNTAAFGSAINNGGSGGTINLLNTTITGNTATGAGGGGSIRRTSGTVNLKNTLVAGNTATTNPDVDGTFTSQGNNLIGNTTGSTGFGGTDLLNVSALLGSLGNYGGTTSTIPLLPGSPAINAGTSTGAPGTDQRGIARVGSVDIGAFESRGFTLTIAGGDNQNTSGGSAFALPLSVTVASANSEPVSGGQVTFTPPGSGASCTLSTNPATITSGAASSTATANTTIGGPYTVSAAANGATSVNFSLTNQNSAPTFTPAAAISRQQGAAAGAAVTVGTVADGQTAAGSLTVTQIAGGMATGITVASITNTGGTITAVVTADCTATPGTVRFQVSDGSLTGTGDLTVNVTTATPPTVANAGSDQTVCATTATLAANTPTVGTGAWSIINGTGGTVTTPSSPTSGFTGVAGNSYTLRWTITGTCATSTDDVVINLTATPTASNAGPDQTFCDTSAATLAANTPSIGTGAWTVVSGPSTLASQFSNVSSPTATFTPAGGTGTYTLRWTISNAPCNSSTDDVVITYNVVPTITLGASPSVFPGTTSANLTYSASTGSPNQYSIDYDSTANTAGFADVTNASLTASPIVLTVPGAAAPGTYNATLTVRSSATGCVSSSTVFTVTISNCPSLFTVNDLGDADDATPGNGVCATAGGVCTLRAAIQEANALTACSPMTINFSLNGTITLGSALPAIAHPNLTITGNGAANTVISGNNTVAGLSVTAAGRTLALNSLSITNANSTTNGAALRFTSDGGTLTLTDCVLSNSTTTANGGGLYLLGFGMTTATLTNTSISGNTAGGNGGGVSVIAGTLTLNGCTISGNSGIGGGIVIGSATLNANNSLFSNNASSTFSGAAFASQSISATANFTGCTFTGHSGVATFTTNGAITITNSTFSGNLNLALNAFSSTTTVINSTFSGNNSNVNADNSGTILNLVNTIVANPTSGSNCSRFGQATLNAQHSLIAGSLSCVNGTNTNNLTDNPLLSALGNYGGTTQTFALLPGSPAINAGTSTGAPTNDQRGIARVGNVDIGAYESRGFTLAIAGGDNQSTAAGSAFASPLSVTVSSTDGEPVNGGQVTFTPPGAGASCTLGTNPATITSGAASSTATANVIIGGPYNVAANANGATAINFSLTNTNSAPTFTPAAAISRQQGAAAGAAVTVGTVADGQTAAGSLTVTQIAGGTATGITVASITNTGGTITAVVTADCTATPGTVRFQVSDGSLTGTGDLTVNVTTATPLTVANAGADQTLCGTTATLAANAPTVGTGAWSIISGSGGSVTTPASPTSGFTGVAGTSYTLRWTITGACATSTDEVVITLTANPTAATAGPDQTLCATSATLAANTPTIGTGSWSIVSGAGGNVTTPSSPTSAFTGVAGTSYTLRWTISNSPCTASTDDVVITLTANPTAANAGSDQAFCGTSAATLAANTPAVGTGAWTVIGGPSTLSSQFSNVNSPTATFTPAGGTGAYTLRWTISNSPCTASSDDVVLTYNALPTITLGASPSVLPGATSANLPYSAMTGSPNQYSIDYNTAANTAGFADVTNVSLTASPIALTVPNGAASGTYNATLTVRNSATGCVSSSTPFTVTISNCPTAFTVNNTGDGADAAPGNGVCETATGNGVCTLRAAIQEANALTACSPMTITITATGTITLGSTLPGIARSNLTISGPGADQLTVSGNDAVAVLQINAATANITLSGLTIANGRITNSTGAGLQNFSNGTVTLNNLAFTGNQTITGGDGAALNHNGTGTLNVNGSTFSSNVSATAGGALAISDVGAVNLTNCTFTGNTALNGGGVYNNLGNLTLLNCTLTTNTATGSAGGLARAGGTVSLKNTLVAGNTATLNPDLAGTFTSQGNNLIGNTTGGTGFDGTDVLNVSALLGTLGNYGGTTNTIPLLPGSPAINAGTSTGAPSSDQRGIARVGNVDIGAFESRGFTLAINSGNNQSATVTTAFALPLSATVTSANSEPVNGGKVTFTPPGAGASCTVAGTPATITSGTATSGTVTANAIIGGPYNVAAGATGAAAINFSLTNANSAPSFTPAMAISRQQGSTAGATVTVGTVSDAQTAAGSLTVTQIAGGTATDITITGITNTNGTITAVLTAGCTATPGTVRFQVSDGTLTGTGDFTVNVTANSVPSVAYANVSVNAGSGTSNSLTSATDNGSITGYALQSQGTYTGTISVNPTTGMVSMSNAVPPGVHTITVRATDNCNAIVDASFTLTVTNTNPTITAQAGITRQQGASASNAQIATVNDAESGATGITVTVNGSASATVNGVTVSNIVNSGGTVTADIVATCGASNASFTLTATDGHAATATATLNVTVTGITLSSLVNGLTFVPYSQTLTASGGSGAYTFSLVSGTLPPGLTLNGNLLSGTPTAAGASTFTIRADDDSNTCFGERVYTINIGSTGLMYYPLARPVRLLDTRPGASANACFQPNAPITGGTTRTQVARGTCEGIVIPANATTITGHITTVQSGGGSLTLYPSDAPQPNVTNSNYLPNEILNNAFTVGLGVNDGAFKLFVGTNTDVVIDVTGYYAPPSASGLYFHPLPKPIRLLDTRTGFTGCQTPGAPLQTATTRTQTGVLTCDGVTIPTGALALVGNATTTNSTGSGYLTLWPADAVQPFASSSNFAAGVNRNAPFTVGLSLNGEFNIYTARTTDLVIDVMGYYSTQANDANGQGLLFNSLGAPLRLLDTRAGQPACYQPGAKMVGQTVYTQETQIPCTNLTSVARGLVGNVSALNAEANGFVTFWPSNAVQPTVATSNYQTGRVFNRHFTVGLGNDVAFKRYVLSTTDLIIDISGFFAP